jgi:hypothetical protein
MRSDDGWAIPDDKPEDWEALVEQLNAALDGVFTSKSREAAKAHHHGFSFLEALALAVDGGTVPLARYILDRKSVV